jgi:hypothetical protein
MEARGGNGYIEDWVNPRLLRDAHLGSIWEGSSNVIALDVLRAIRRDHAHEALFTDIAARLDAVRDPAVARAAALLRPRLAGLRGRVELTAGLPRDEAELPMLELSDRLYQLYAASLLVEEAEAQARAGSYRKLVLAAEFIRRRLTADPDGWPGPRPGSGACFPALMRWQPVPGETARSLLDVLEQRSP